MIRDRHTASAIILVVGLVAAYIAWPAVVVSFGLLAGTVALIGQTSFNREDS